MTVLTDKRARLRREIQSKTKELAKLDALPDFSDLADGSVVALFVTHGASDPYTYVAFLNKEAFYLTGANSPNGVSVDGLADWLTTSGRRLIGMLPIAILETGVVPSNFDLGEALLKSMTSTSSTRRFNPYTFRESPEYGD